MQLQIIDLPTSPLIITIEKMKEHMASRINTSRCNYSDMTNIERFIEDIEKACDCLCRHGEKIRAIALFRAVFPIGLKEAKDYIEARFDC